MKFQFSSSVTLAFGKHEPVLKLCSQAFCQKGESSQTLFSSSFDKSQSIRASLNAHKEYRMKFRFIYDDITLACGPYESALKWGMQAFRPKAKARKLHLALRDEDAQSVAVRSIMQRSST